MGRKRKTHCKYGHELTPENVYIHGPNGEYRRCRTCALDASRKRRQAAVTKSGSTTDETPKALPVRKSSSGKRYKIVQASSRPTTQQQSPRTTSPSGLNADFAAVGDAFASLRASLFASREATDNRGRR